MKVYQGLDELDGLPRAAVTIGNFDGVHRGHQALLLRLRELAAERGRDTATIAITFNPHPVQFFRGSDAPSFKIASQRQKVAWIAETGLDGLVILRFNAEIASLPPERFVEDVLVGGLHCSDVLVGYDFSFGKGRTGSFDDIARVGKRMGFRAESFAPVMHEGSPISSSRIRSCLGAGAVREAESLLGHPFALDGKVVHGDARGRQLGFPTANIAVPEQAMPARGVYICTLCQREAGTRHAAIANIGSRPTFHGEAAPVVVEAFLLDPSLPVDLDLYELEVELELHRYVRPEKSFDEVSALIAQIESDVAQARRFHGIVLASGSS